MFLERFTLPDEDQEWQFFMRQQSRASSDYYPFQLFIDKQVPTLRFEPITILYGNNGSGKSTLLNVMAEALGLRQSALANQSAFFKDYVALTTAELGQPLPQGASLIKSDDVFDAMLNLRAVNQGVDQARQNVMDDYLATKFSQFQYHDFEDYDQLKKVLETRRKTQSRYAREHVMKNVRTFSNGESALQYFQMRLKDNNLYLLDEPENSLSPAHQQELAQQLNDQARFFGCQFVIATHSPFLMALPHAKVYDLDSVPVATRQWTELPAIQTYARFFEEHRGEF